MHKALIISFIAALLLPKASCAQDPTTPIENYFWPAWAIDPPPREHPQEFEYIMTEGLITREQTVDMPWSEADEYCRLVLILDGDHIFFSKLEQDIAFLMLERYLLADSLTEEMVEPLGFYTELLLKHGTPDAYTILRALERLEGHWSQEKIAAAARSTFESAEKWFALPSNRIETDAGEPLFSDLMSLRNWHMHESLSKLKAYADLQ